MNKRDDRVGEININNQGLKMTIIKYNKYGDIDVEFEDGYIAKNKSYQSFKKGEIKNINFKATTRKPLTNRIGEINTNNQGESMRIVEYKDSHNIIVEFEDGERRECDYKSFKEGSLLHPHYDYDKTGEERINNFGSKMIIIAYRKAIDIDVYFPEYDWCVKTSYNNFLKRDIKCPYEPRTFGVGYLGEGKYQPIINKKKNLAYKYWISMMERCYSKDFQNKHSSYIKSTVCEEWHNFQNFAEWFYENYYEIKGEKMQLENNILMKGNMIYCPEYSIFAPVRINNLFVKMLNSSDRNGLIGTRKLSNGKYGWQCSYINELGEYKRATGTCNTEEEAFELYKEFKENYIKQVADEYYGLIPRELWKAMWEYEIEITD